MTDTTRDQPDEPATGPAAEARTTPGHLVITVHGIRTYGGWQVELKDLLWEADPTIVVRNYDFGYFSSIAFLIPILRWLVVRRFRRFFEQEVRAMPPGSRIDLVAHSFGTYLAASALRRLPEGRRIHTVIFAGSVLRPSFPWYKHQEGGAVVRVINECGTRDSILVLCQSTALWLGMAGRVGFRWMSGERFVNRYSRFGHGGYFDRDRQFMRRRWLPLLTGDEPVEQVADERETLTAWGGIKLFLINNLQFIKVGTATLLTLAVVWVPIDWMRKADYQRRVERFARIARLANAKQIPGRDPSHVRDLLRVDVSAAEDGKSIDHIIGTETAPDGEEEADAIASEEEAAPSWWERLTGLRDREREAYRARQLHARANHQLAVGKQGNARDLSKARLLFEDAIASYRRVGGHEPSHGSYALCLLDYGLLLNEMGFPEQAIAQFRKVRDEVFPQDPRGRRPMMPRSLMVDSLCYEAMALKALERWGETADCLMNAAREAGAAGEEGPDHALLSFVYNELAWLNMDRLDVAEADDNFARARESCERLVENGQFVFTTRLFHIRHGQAMVMRLRGDADKAYDHYDRLVGELQVLMKRDLDFNPKQRRDLRDRLANSMERRADVRFFARRSPTHFPAITKSSADYLDLLRKVEDDYQEAIDLIRNDDLGMKTTLLYRKVIAQFLGELAEGDAAGTPEEDRGTKRGGRKPIEIEFAEAEMTYASLSPALKKSPKIFREIAACCMDMHKSRENYKELTVDGIDPSGERGGRFSRQAVTGLRALTTEYARRCGKLNRDGVEMLLVALEILLERDVVTDPTRSAQDASLMLAVIGSTTQVAAHEELRRYVDRFNTIAHQNLAPSHARIQPTQLIQDRATSRNPQGRLLFFLRLSPTRSLMVTEGPEGPRIPLGTDPLIAIQEGTTPAAAEGGTVVEVAPSAPVGGEPPLNLPAVISKSRDRR